MLRRIVPLSMFTALALQGCAVLTVDVDVYKGPLVNHEDVQMEQLAAMAVGARPLLIQLRDNLEYRATKVEPGTDTCYRGRPHVPDDCPLKAESAQFVNAVLALYLDRDQVRQPNSPLHWCLQRGQEIFDECGRLKAILDDWRNDTSLGDAVDAQSDEGKALVDFLDRHDVKDLAPFLDANLKAALRAAAATPNPQVADTPVARTNLDFERLRDRTETERFVGPFVADGKARQQIVNRIVAVGDAYVRGRKLLDEAVDLTLRFLDEIRDSKLTPDAKARAELAATEILATIIQPKSLFVALSNDAWQSPDKSWLEERLGGSRVRMLATIDEWTDVDYRRATTQIKLAVEEDPAHAVRALREAHRTIRETFTPSAALAGNSGVLTTYMGSQKLRGTDVAYARQRYGIARALTIAPADAAKIQEHMDIRGLVGLVERVQRALGDLGLGEGRHDRGLIQLIDNYIRSRDDLATAHIDERAEKRVELIDALIHFAEKIRFVVSHDALLRASSGDGDPYVMVLESVSNSILTLNDERHFRDEFNRSDRKEIAADRELRAAQSAWRSDPATSFDDVTRAVLGQAVIPESLLAAERKTWLDAAGDQEQKKRERIKADRDLATAKADQEQSSKAEAEAKAEQERLVAAKASAADIEAAAKKHEKALESKLKAEASVTTATATANSKKTAFDTAVTTESNAKSAYEALVAALKTKSAELIQAARTSVLGSVTKDPVKPSRERVVGALTAELLERASKASGTAQAELKAAADLAAAQPLTDLPDVILPSCPESPTEVLDQITATLRNARIAAKAQGNATQDKNLEQALQLAESYRSPMVYIRPPASFLRNSSPVSTLQDNQVGWRNMLTEVAGAAFNGAPTQEQKERVETQTAIDRQFWQNINRVRVTGTGDTTYALVKDDIGNWYVKGYKGDPEKVIKGVQAMALTAVSGAMKAGVLQRAQDVEKARASGTPLDPKSSPTVLGKQVDHFQKLYQDATEKDAKELKAATDEKASDGIVAKVKDSWTKLVTEKSGLLLKDAKALTAAVDDAAKAPFDKKPTAVPADKGAKQAEFCADNLKRVADFQTALLTRLDEKQLVDATVVDQPRKDIAGKEAEVAAKKSEQVAAEQNLATLQELKQAAIPPADIDARISAATDRLTKAKGDVGTAEAELAKARGALTDAEAKVAQARSLVLALRRSTIEIVGGTAQKFVDRRADAVEDYQTALQVLGQRPNDGAAVP